MCGFVCMVRKGEVWKRGARTRVDIVRIQGIRVKGRGGKDKSHLG